MRSNAGNPRKKRRGISPALVWALLFAVWSVFASGVVMELTGSPGVRQAIGLRGLRAERRADLARVEGEARRLERLRSELESSRPIQESEIRRVLGYVAPGELVFEFPAKTN